MSGGLIAFIVGVGIGLVIVIPILWRYRVEVEQTWREALGIAPRSPVAASELSSDLRGRSWRLARKRWLAVGLCLAASLGNAVLLIETNEARVLHVVGIALFAIAAGLLILTSRAGES